MTLGNARALRRRQTDAEKKLWLHLRDRRFQGLKFRRQLRIEPYIVDFACYEPKLIIELDGGHHAQQPDYDATRTQFLERLGYRVLRFWDNDVLKNIDAVLQELLLTTSPPSPQPSPGGRGGESVERVSSHALSSGGIEGSGGERASSHSLSSGGRGNEEIRTEAFPPLPPGEGWGEGVTTAKPPTPLIHHLHLRNYTDTWHAMQQFTAQRNTTTPDEIWLLEHPRVYTQGLNGKPEHLLAPGNIPLVQTDRGGQVTYHGPGQLIVYVLLDLQRRGWGVRQLVEALELSVIDLLRDYGITAIARRDAPGVYVNGAKIAALGLRVKRGCSYHGLSLNVAMDLEPFRRINPCGYAGLPVTQLTALGTHNNLAEVTEDLLRHLTTRLGYNIEP